MSNDSGKTSHIVYAGFLIFCIITCGFALTVDEKSSFVAIGIATVISAIICFLTILLLLPISYEYMGWGIDDVREKTFRIKKKSTWIMLAAASLLSTISLSAVWHDFNNAKAIWVWLMNGLGTALYGASVYALVMPHFNVDGKE
jgi:hypothetical protein